MIFICHVSWNVNLINFSKKLITMSHLSHYLTRFQSGNFYHIYNRGVDRQLIFKNPRNYHYFMKLWKRHLAGYLDVVSYSLNANHFHFLVRVPTFEPVQLLGRTAHELIAGQLKVFFRSYALAFNKNHLRTGSLFEGPFKRVHVGDINYLTYLMHYIHFNPEKNKLCADFRTWEWSSYKDVLKRGKSLVDRKFVVEWFGSIQEYKLFHLRENHEVDIRSFLSGDED
jgi:putative transposase